MQYPKKRVISTDKPHPMFSAEALAELAKLDKRIKKLLANCHCLSKDDEFLLQQIYLVCCFRQAKGKKRDGLLREIDEQSKEGLALGFTGRDLWLLNQWVLKQEFEGELQNLLQVLKSKTAKRKKK